MKWFEKGDFDGFFALGLNNFVNFLLIINLSLFVLGFSMEMVATRNFPPWRSVFSWNLFYSSAMVSLGRATDGCYGINLFDFLT